MGGSQCQTPLLTGRRAQWLQVGRSGCEVGVGETTSAIACRHLGGGEGSLKKLPRYPRLEKKRAWEASELFKG